MNLKKNTEVTNMSSLRTIKLTCSECGEKFEFELYDTVNATMDPELKKKLLKGNLFAAKCPKCELEKSLLHPFLYQDMDKDFIVRLDDYVNLLEFNEELKEDENSITKVMSNTKVIGATSLPEMVSIVVAFDNNLDWRIVQTVLLYKEFDYEKFCTEKKLKIKKIVCLLLTGNKNKNDELEIVLVAEDGDEIISYMEKDLYEKCVQEFGERMKAIDPFIVDRSFRNHFITMFEEDYQTQEENKQRYTIIQTNNGSYLISPDIPGFLKDRIDVRDLVLFRKKDGSRGIGRVKRIVEYNFLSVSFQKGDVCFIDGEYKDFHFLTTANPEKPLNQEQLLQHLEEYFEKRTPDDSFEKIFPIQELMDSKMIVCTSATIAFEDMKQYNGEEMVEVVRKNLESGRADVFLNLEKVKIDDKTYLAVYSDQFYLPDSKDYKNKAVLDFDTFARIIKVDPDYDGIIINQYHDNIVLSANLLRMYIHCRTLADDNRMKELLNNLTPNEISYVGETSFKCIRAVYFDGLKPKDLEKEFNLTEEQVDEALDHGYNTLDKIVYAQF